MNKLREHIKNFAKLNGCIAGICDAKPLSGERARLAAVDTPFVSRDVEKRIDPGLTLPGAKSVIVLGKGYEPSPYSNLSSLGFSSDYHNIIADILEELAENLKENFYAVFNYTVMVDSGPLAERAFAIKAGLGYRGKNTCVISKEFGSFFNIGLLVVDFDLFFDSGSTDGKPMGSSHEDIRHEDTGHEDTSPTATEICFEDCRRCIDACPTDALSPYFMDPALCISYLTQKKGKLNDGQINAIKTSNQLYGCDLCQIACPKNECAENRNIENKNKCVKNKIKDPNVILSLDEAGFAEEFGHTAMAWRGLKHLQRNAGYCKTKH